MGEETVEDNGIGLWVALAVVDGAMQGWLPGIDPWADPEQRQAVAIALGEGLQAWGSVARWLISQEMGQAVAPPPWPLSKVGQSIAQLPILWRYRDIPTQGMALLDRLGQAPVPDLLGISPWQPHWAPTTPDPTLPWRVALHQSRGDFALALAHSFTLSPPQDPLQPLLTALALGSQRGLAAIPMPWRLALHQPRPGGNLWQQRWHLSSEASLQSLAQGLWLGWAGWGFPISPFLP